VKKISQNETYFGPCECHKYADHPRQQCWVHNGKAYKILICKNCDRAQRWAEYIAANKNRRPERYTIGGRIDNV